MANFATLKAAINAVIKTNGQKEITGEVLNQVLNAMVTSLGTNYQFAGVATPNTNPGTPDQNVFYMATQAGTYTNFNATVLPVGISILLWNGSWSHQTFFEIDSVPTSGSTNLVTSGGVFEKMKLDGGAYDVSAHNGGITFASLEALLNDANLNTLIPVAVRTGGMSIKFVQSSDNKYIQARCMANEFTTDTTQWAIAEEGVYEDNPEFIYVKKDADDRVLFAVKVDGSIFFGAGCPPQVVEYIQKKIDELNLDDVTGIITFLGELPDGDKTLQQILNEKVDKEDGKGLSTNDYDDEAKEIVDSNEFVDNQEFLEVVKDSEDTLLESTKPSGKKKFYAGIEVDGVAELENVTANNIAAKSIEFYTEEEKESFLDYLNISSAINAPRYIGLKDIAAYRTSNDKYGSFDLAFKISEFLNSPIVLKTRARYVKTAETDNIPTITIYQEKELGQEVHFNSQIYEFGKEGNDYSIREYRIILPPPECTYFHLVVDVPENIELHISDFSSSYKEGMMNSNVSHLVDCHGIVGKFCALSDVERCVINGFNSCIVVPKKTSDGVWCCFHDDDNINGLSYPNGQKVCVKDGNTYTQYDEQGNVIGSSAMPVSSLTWEFLSTLNYRAATFDRTYVETIDDFLEVCVKTGVSPVFSIHPNWSSSDKAWFKSRLIQYGLLNKAVFIIQPEWLSSYYEVFGDNIGGYCIFPTATTLAGVQETIALLANYNTQNGKYWIEMIYANMGDDATAQSLVSEINNSTKTIDGNTVPTGIKVCVFATGQDSSVLRKLILWGVNRIGTNKLFSYGLNW